MRKIKISGDCKNKIVYNCEYKMKIKIIIMRWDLPCSITHITLVWWHFKKKKILYAKMVEQRCSFTKWVDLDFHITFKQNILEYPQLSLKNHHL